MDKLSSLDPRAELRTRKLCLRVSQFLLLAAGSAVIAQIVVTIVTMPFLRTMTITFLTMLTAGFIIHFVTWSMSAENKVRIRELEQEQLPESKPKS